MDYIRVINLSAPALNWDVMVDMTKVDLELISDADMYLFFEKGMRDSASYMSKSIVKKTISI